MRIASMTKAHEETLRNIGTETGRLLRPLLVVVAIVWLLEIIDRLFFGGSLDHFGILPRHLIGLRGIFIAPFLHGGFGHLLANTVPFILLGFLIMLRHSRHILAITVTIVAISGLGTWLIAPANTVHIGASGIIFGYFAFLVVNAWYERSMPSMLVGILVIILYGGLLAGILPSGNGVSWQGHLFGLLGGIVAAVNFSPRRRRNAL